MFESQKSVNWRELTIFDVFLKKNENEIAKLIILILIYETSSFFLCDDVAKTKLNRIDVINFTRIEF